MDCDLSALCDDMLGCSTKEKKIDFDLDDLRGCMPSFTDRRSLRRQPSRDCKSTLRVDPVLLKKAKSILVRSDSERKKVSTGTKWETLMNQSGTAEIIKDLQTQLSSEIRYAKILLSIFTILEENPEVLEKDLYGHLYNHIIDQRELIGYLDELTEANIEKAFTLLKITTTSGDKYVQANVQNKLTFKDPNGKKYDRNDFGPIIGKLKKIVAIKNMDVDDGMIGGSSEILRLYKKYCK